MIRIIDDGIGMSKDRMKSLFSETSAEHSKGFSGIGVKNVDDRIKLTYGQAYGLEINSEEGIFTEVIIKIPIEK